mgnify:CR=1 FL=1
MNTSENKYENLCGSDWEKLLIENPSIAVECDKYNGWDKLDTHFKWEWFRILEKHPQFIDKAKKYFQAWYAIIALYPEYAKDFFDWDSFSGFDWFAILKHQPQFSTKCDESYGWRLITKGSYWYVLLAYQPQFADKCTQYDGWRYIEWCDWDFLLGYQPQFKNKYNEFHKKEEDEVCGFHGRDWVGHLIKYPSDIKICDRLDGWSTLDEEDWRMLLQAIPYLDHKKKFCGE